MIRSMTGYGRSQQQLNGWDITVEIKSVNHRYFEFSCRTPRNCAFLEDKLKAQVQSRISRGKVDCYCAIVSTDAGDSAVLFNRALAKSYLAAMRELSEETGLPFEVTLRDLARLPDVFTVERAVSDEEALTAAVQTVAAEALGALGKIPAHGGVLGIHRVAAGDKGHHTTGTHLIQRLGEKVVVNVEIQLVIGFVPDLILAERHIADGKVIKVPSVGGLKSGHGNVSLGIELLGNPPADGIQLHAVQLASGHTLRQHTEEIAYTTRRLQDVAGLKSHTPYGFINCPDYRRAGVVRVEGGTSGGSVFLRGQQLFQLGIFRSPCRFLQVKGIGKTAPAHIPG